MLNQNYQGYPWTGTSGQDWVQMLCALVVLSAILRGPSWPHHATPAVGAQQMLLVLDCLHTY